MLKNLVCPYCRSRTPEGAACDYCGSPLGDRDVDVHFDSLVPAQQQRLRALLLFGVPISAGVTFVSPLLTGPFHLLLSVPLLVIAAAIAVRIKLITPVQWLLSRPRRFISRWTRRLCFYPVALWGFAIAGTPIIGALAGAATFAGLSIATHRYMMWNVRLDANRVPIRGFERTILIAAALSALAFTALFVTATALLAWLVSHFGR